MYNYILNFHLLTFLSRLSAFGLRNLTFKSNYLFILSDLYGIDYSIKSNYTVFKSSFLLNYWVLDYIRGNFTCRRRILWNSFKLECYDLIFEDGKRLSDKQIFRLIYFFLMSNNSLLPLDFYSELDNLLKCFSMIVNFEIFESFLKRGGSLLYTIFFF